MTALLPRIDRGLDPPGREKKTTLFRFWVDGMTPGVSMTEVTIAGSALSWTPADVAEAVREFLTYL